MDLTKLVYIITQKFPEEEKYGLKSQMCRYLKHCRRFRQRF